MEEGDVVHHHINYFPEIKVDVHGWCHTQIHQTDRYPSLKPKEGDAKKFYKSGTPIFYVPKFLKSFFISPKYIIHGVVVVFYSNEDLNLIKASLHSCILDIELRLKLTEREALHGDCS